MASDNGWGSDMGGDVHGPPVVGGCGDVVRRRCVDGLERNKTMKRVFWAVLMVLGLTSAAHAATVTLAWDASTTSSVTGYKIYVSTTTGVYGSGIDVGKVLTYTVPGLAEGTKYYFVATAYNPGQESGYSNEVSTTTPWSKPNAPNLKPVVSAVASLKQMQIDLAAVPKASLTTKQASLLTTAVNQIRYAANNLASLLKLSAYQGVGLRIEASS